MKPGFVALSLTLHLEIVSHLDATKKKPKDTPEKFVYAKTKHFATLPDD